MTEVLASEEAPPFTLTPRPRPGREHASILMVEWEISTGTRDLLVQLNAHGVRMLIVVVDSTGEEMSRQFVKLSQGRAYIDFYRPGDNHILAAIVYNSGNTGWQDLRDRRDGKYVNTLFRTNYEYGDDDVVTSTTYELLEYPPKVDRIRGGVKLLHTVAGDEFGQPSWRVTHWIATHGWWDTEPKDGCQTRRRATIMVLTLPAVAVVAALAIGVFLLIDLLYLCIYAVLLFFGVRSLNFSVLLKPFSHGTSDIWSRAKPSVWTYKKVKTGYGGQVFEKRNPVCYVLNPVFALLATIIATTSHGTWDGPGLKYALLGLAVVIVIFAVLGYLATRPEKPKPVLEPDTGYRRRMLEELGPVTAGSAEAPAPTIGLAYLGFKAKVCKPYAKPVNR